MPNKHKVGDVCLTTNTNLPAVNNGVLVVVLSVDHTVRSARGEVSPYLIRRLDGRPFVGTNSISTGKPSWCKWLEVWSAGYKLKPRVDTDVKEETRELEEVTP